MESVKQALKSYLDSQDSVSWRIIHDIERLVIDNDSVKFRSMDKSSREDPLGFPIGFISIEPVDGNDSEACKIYIDSILSLVRVFIDNYIALSNIYIVAIRTSCNPDYSFQLIDSIINAMSPQKSEQVFKHLITSLNVLINAHNDFIVKLPQTVEAWRSHFRSVFRSNPNVLDYDSIAKLITKDRTLYFKWLDSIHPIIIAFLVEFDGYKVQLSNEDIASFDTASVLEVTFVVEYVSENLSEPKKIDWFNDALAKSLMITHWNAGGKQLVKLLLNKVTRPQAESIKSSLDFVLGMLVDVFRGYQAENTVSLWFSTLSFPEDFIMVSALIMKSNEDKEGRVDLSAITNELRRAMVDNLLLIIGRPEKLIKKVITNKSSYSAFEFYNIEGVYQNLLVVVCYIFLAEDSVSIDEIKKICYKYKQYFYCDYDSVRIAEEFTEFILLVLLSITKIEGLRSASKKKWKKLMRVVSTTILYPYIMVAEEDGYIWNPDLSCSSEFYALTKKSINRSLSDLLDSEYKVIASDFIEDLFKCKTAKWPFER
ncbi:MAG: hypothetical protein PHO37_15025 [Kiritimatiellae bacterium]|nr:hypothetical protein [Kiritimatiellia bacterium]